MLRVHIQEDQEEEEEEEDEEDEEGKIYQSTTCTRKVKNIVSNLLSLWSTATM